MPTLLMITPENSEINRFRAHQYNNFTQLTMPYLAGFVPDEYKIRLIDEFTEKVPYEKFDLVAITVNTPNAPHSYEMAKRFRQLGSWVVLGGPHVTLTGIVFGFDSDTVEVFENTLQLCEAIGIDGVTASILTPFPGTTLYKQSQKEGRLLPVDWSYYNGKTRVAFVPKHITPDELLEGYNKFRGKFYSWRSIVLRLTKSRVNLAYNLLINLGYRQAHKRFMGSVTRENIN